MAYLMLEDPDGDPAIAAEVAKAIATGPPALLKAVHAAVNRELTSKMDPLITAMNARLDQVEAKVNDPSPRRWRR